MAPDSDRQTLQAGNGKGLHYVRKLCILKGTFDNDNDVTIGLGTKTASTISGNCRFLVRLVIFAWLPSPGCLFTISCFEKVLSAT